LRLRTASGVHRLRIAGMRIVCSAPVPVGKDPFHTMATIAGSSVTEPTPLVSIRAWAALGLPQPASCQIWQEARHPPRRPPRKYRSRNDRISRHAFSLASEVSPWLPPYALRRPAESGGMNGTGAPRSVHNGPSLLFASQQPGHTT
jgi:hypothetical protein